MIATLVRNARLIWRLLWDRRVSGWLKMIPAAAVAYLILPLDLIPDLLLGLGQLDDLAVLFLGVRVFMLLVPREVVESHLREMTSVDASYRVVEDEEGRDSDEVNYIEASYRLKEE
jgi:uncharacterized membrane protein YkvA (DUF1232 family)